MNLLFLLAISNVVDCGVMAIVNRKEINLYYLLFLSFCLIKKELVTDIVAFVIFLFKALSFICFTRSKDGRNQFNCIIISHRFNFFRVLVL